MLQNVRYKKLDLGTAFRAFFEGRAKYPGFKKKGHP